MALLFSATWFHNYIQSLLLILDTLIYIIRSFRYLASLIMEILIIALIMTYRQWFEVNCACNKDGREQSWCSYPPHHVPVQPEEPFSYNKYILVGRSYKLRKVKSIFFL